MDREEAAPIADQQRRALAAAFVAPPLPPPPPASLPLPAPPPSDPLLNRDPGGSKNINTGDDPRRQHGLSRIGARDDDQKVDAPQAAADAKNNKTTSKRGITQTLTGQLMNAAARARASSSTGGSPQASNRKRRASLQSFDSSKGMWVSNHSSALGAARAEEVVTPASTAAVKSVFVAVRMRPTLHGEEEDEVLMDATSGQIVLKKAGSREKSFGSDALFTPESTQRDVFRIVARPLLDQVLQGNNASILAYGAMRTGKTHTMIGERSRTGMEAGIVPRTLEYLLSKAAVHPDITYQFSLSFVELYGDTLTDLLDPGRSNLTIKNLLKNNCYNTLSGRLCKTSHITHHHSPLQKFHQPFYPYDL